MATVVTNPINIPYPAIDGELELRIEAGACRLRVAPADQDTWISGNYHDPGGSIVLTTRVDGNRAFIQVGRSPADVFGFLSGIPELSLQVGTHRPFALTVAAGASENHLELGGLPISRLEINHGAGSLEVTFSTPTSVPTAFMKFGVGAGRTDVFKLGNVDVAELAIEGGAASCLLDFTGSGLRNTSVRLSTAMAAVELRIPATLATEITSENLLGQPQVDAGFSRRGRAWVNQAAAQGTPPQLRIRSTMVMGQLHVQTTA